MKAPFHRRPATFMFLALLLALFLAAPASSASEPAIPLKIPPPRSLPIAPAPAGPSPKPAFRETAFPPQEAANLREIMAVIGPLSPAEMKFLEKNRFLLRPKPAPPPGDSRPVYDEALSAFDRLGGPLSEHLRRPENARFIGPDIFIHALSRYLAIRQFAAETGPMRETLLSLLNGLYENAAALRAGRGGRSAEDWERLAAQLLVPLLILDLPAEPTDADDGPAAALARLSVRAPFLSAETRARLGTELGRIYRAEETAPGLLGLAPVDLSPAVDYSLFKPWGPYAASPAGRSFFRAAAYLSRLGWNAGSEEGLADAMNMALAFSYEPRPAAPPEAGPRADLTRLTELAGFFYGFAGAPGWTEWTSFMMKEADVPEFTAATAAEGEIRRRLLAAIGELTAVRRQFTELRLPSAAPVLTLWPRRLDFPRLMAEELTGPLTGPLAGRAEIFSAVWLPALWDHSQAAAAFLRQVEPAAAGGSLEASDFLGRAAQALKDRPEEDWFSSLGSAWWRVWTTLSGRYGAGYPLYMRSPAFAAKELETLLGALTELPALLNAAAPLTRTDLLRLDGQEETALDDRGPAPVVKGFVEPNPDFWRQMNRLVKFVMAGFQHYGLFPEDMEDDGALTRFLRRLERVIDLAEKELSGEALTDDDYEFIRLFTLDWMAAPLGAPRERPWPESETGAVGAEALRKPGPGAPALYEALAESWLMLVLVGDDASPRLTLGLAFNHYEFLSPLSRLKVAELWRQSVYSAARLAAAEEAGLPPKNFWYEPLWPSE